MSTPLGTYSFLPWLRQGIAGKITAAAALRGAIPEELEHSGEALNGAAPAENISRDIQPFGPGDIAGIDNRVVVRTEPRNLCADFEPNHLPAIEFHDEDFPWRYTPAAPDVATKRLLPWIALVVLKEGEFEEVLNVKDNPLPFIKVSDPNLFQPAEQLWAWAHVQVNSGLDAEIASTGADATLPDPRGASNKSTGRAYSRIVCPRKLEENAAYHAFLVPVFETGRLAGLGIHLDPAKIPSATHSSWAGYAEKPEPEYFPVYIRWRFHTGNIGDFEYLARSLQPKPASGRVGRRDMDMRRPGSNLPGGANPDLGESLRLGGALVAPEIGLNQKELEEAKKYEDWDQPYPHKFQTALAAFINLADDYTGKAAAEANHDSGISEEVENDPDPLITPPLYGRWHALTRRLLLDINGYPILPDDNWAHELNLDPRFRVPAGFGTKVVQEKKEEYISAAREQMGDLIEANKLIRVAQLAKEVSRVWYDRLLKSLRAANAEKAFAMTAPVHKRVLSRSFTIFQHVNSSVVTPAIVSATMRRILRPRARLMRLLQFEGGVRPDTLIARINDGEVSAAPPKQVPAGVLKVNEVAEALASKDTTPGAAAALVSVYKLLSRWAGQVKKSDSIREENQTPESVDDLRRSPDFVISDPGSGFTSRRGSTDSPEAARFKTALKDAYTLISASARAARVPPRTRIEIAALADETIRALDPELTIPRRAVQIITVPDRLKAILTEEFKEAMAYPEIDQPMYEPLRDISSELFLPNINLIEQNSVTLLETNQRFIEAYMVGLNHEFARELLWREFPTDQRGSCFRQFWDARGCLDPDGLDEEALKEKLRDIPPLDKWPKVSELGDHKRREEGGAKAEEVVLVIRGELLRKYPNTVVHAHRARWRRNSEPGGPIDDARERQLEELAGAEIDNPPPSKVKTPLYRAKVEPDVFFFGFDLTVEQARGGAGETLNDDPGWFFALKEAVGDPRFGLDIKKSGAGLNGRNDLSWERALPDTPAGAYIRIDNSMPPFQSPAPEAWEKSPRNGDDASVEWSKDSSSADLAYILYQAPALVAIHATEMLPKK